jgi:hypothetical protein
MHRDVVEVKAESNRSRSSRGKQLACAIARRR